MEEIDHREYKKLVGETIKIAIQTKPGGFRLSTKAIELMIERGAIVTIWRVDKNGNQTEIENKSAMFVLDADWSKALGDDNPFPKYYFVDDDNKYRDFPLLIDVIEELGDESHEIPGGIKIVHVPADLDWFVHEWDDGSEAIRENYREWS